MISEHICQGGEPSSLLLHIYANVDIGQIYAAVTHYSLFPAMLARQYAEGPVTSCLGSETSTISMSAREPQNLELSLFAILDFGAFQKPLDILSQICLARLLKTLKINVDKKKTIKMVILPAII